jgi:nitroimidazol reductase NimA-like FMN-containing flavoprotein (pyridoxamine 5'-phosphate oxidase superfamily)
MMRRSDKEIKNKETIQWVLKKAQVCRIAFCDNNKPYIVPMNFGFDDNYLYLHSAPEGQKINILSKNRNICFEVDIKNELVKSEIACDWGMKYYSVIGYGKVDFIDDIEEKKKVLDIIIEKYNENDLESIEYSKSSLNKVAIFRVEIEEITGKKSGYFKA